MEIPSKNRGNGRKNAVFLSEMPGLYCASRGRDKEHRLKETLDTNHPIGPIERTLNLLLCFQAHSDGLSLTELARMVDLAPSTTTRLLKVLERYGFISRGLDRLYRLGPQSIQLGLTALRDLSLYDVVRPHLHMLAEETGESAQLGILARADKVLYVDQVSSNHVVQVATWVGRTVPLEDTAIGAAIQGHVCSAGYIATRHTIEPDVSSVAAPIFDKNNTIIAAINIIGPTYRISDDHLEEIGLLAAKHTQQISQKLGAACS
jgi:DNA-binding IclR family transcriptional regulator